MKKRQPDIGTPQANYFALEAEQSIVAALFSEQSAEAYDRLVLGVKADDFYYEHHKVIFQAYGVLVERGVKADAITLATHIKSSEGFDHRVEDAVANALSVPFSMANIEAYAEAVAEKARARQLHIRLTEINRRTSQVGGAFTSKDLLREIESVGMAFGEDERTNELLRPPSDLMGAAIERLEHLQNGDIVGVKTGIEGLDEKLGGLMPGNLVIVAGRPSMGKTAFALNIAIEHGIRNVQEPTDETSIESPVIAVFSLEMSNTQLGFRCIANIGSIDHDRLRKAELTEQDWNKLPYALGKYERSAIHTDFDATLTPSVLRSKLRLLKRKLKRDISLVVVDYLQLMSGDNAHYSNRNEEVTDISRNMKRIAKEFSCPVIALSQLNRALEQRADKRPMMSDLRESGAVEQDADIILFLYRDEYYNPDSSYKGIAEVIAAKARDGGTGTVPAEFIGEHQRFRSMSHGAHSYESKYKAGTS